MSNVDAELEIADAVVVMSPALFTLNLLAVPTCKSKSKELEELVVPGVVAFTTKALNTVDPVPFHVWLIVTGASDVSVPEFSHEFRDTRLLIEASVSQMNV